MADDDKTDQTVKRLLETTPDVFIFQALRSGVSGEVVKSLLRIDTDRITRVQTALVRNCGRSRLCAADPGLPEAVQVSTQADIVRSSSVLLRVKTA